ncbi:MAG: tail fiber domain-containing protein, partial [Cytophagales bacterium]
GSSGLSNAVAIGTNATVGGSNMMALGGTGSNAVRVGIGTGSPSVRVHIVGDALGNDDLTIESYAPSANSASLSLSKARGTDASKLPITAGDRIGVVFFDGYNGTVFSRSSYIAAFAETDYGTSVNSNLVFYTASNGIPTEKIRITADGNVGIGTGTPNQRLAIVGNSSVTGVGYFSSIAGLALNGATAGSVVTVDGTGKLGFGTLASGGGSLSGAGQTNGLAYYTSANTLTSNGSNLSWNGREMNMNGIRFYTTSTGPNSSLVIGKDAGNTTFIGVNNNFIGYNAGYKNTTGDDNNFLGFWAGLNNATGSANNFLGSGAGYSNTTGSDNNFLGNQAGTSNTTGGGNNFIGANAGLTNTVGNNNIAIGREADMASNNLTNAIAIGFQAKVGGSNMMVLGGTGVYAVNVGIGTSTPGAPLDVRASGFAGNGELIAQFGTGASPRVRIYDEFSGPNLGPRIYFNAGAIGIIEGGGNIAIMPATGNVGIGTTAPGAALDVINAANGIRINQWLSTGASVGGGAYVGTNIYRNLSDNVWKYTNTHLNIGGAAIQFNGNDGAATENDILFVRTNTPGTVNADATVLESMRIKGGTGFVGIGTSTPEFPLDINRSATGTFTAANFFQNSGALANGAGTIGVSVRATGAFWSTGSSNSGGFYVSSDQRIKRKVGLSDSRNDLSTLMKLKITDYKYTDSLNTGNVQVKGVFAQEVEKVYPQAISKQTNWIPNIYAVAEQVAFDEANQTLKVTINKTHGLTIGDKVKLISNASGEKPAMVVSVNGNSFTVNKWTEKSEKIFVYGKEVNDFRIVDYDRIFILGISAIQELNKNLEAEKAKNMQLELQIQKMEAESKGIKAEIEMIKTHLGLEVKGQK